jgi:hypothetical protein
MKLSSLGPLTKSGYIRIMFLVVGFYFAVQSLVPTGKVDRTRLAEDLRETAQQLSSISSESIPPSTFNTLQSQGFISSSLRERCEAANVVYNPGNATNTNEQPVFEIPGDDRRRMLVTPTGGLRKGY